MNGALTRMSQQSFAGSVDSTGPLRMPDDGEPPQNEPLGGGGALPQRRKWSFESLFRGASTGAGLAVLVIIVAIGVFLIAKALPALQDNKSNFFTETQWRPDSDHRF